MTMALQIMRDLRLKLRGDLTLEYVVDEELTGYGTLAAIQRGYRADAGICLETSDLDVQPACVGRLWFTLEVPGKAVSVTRHWEGVSAIDKGIKFVQAFKELEQIGGITFHIHCIRTIGVQYLARYSCLKVEASRVRFQI